MNHDHLDDSRTRSAATASPSADSARRAAIVPATRSQPTPSDTILIPPPAAGGVRHLRAIRPGMDSSDRMPNHHRRSASSRPLHRANRMLAEQHSTGISGMISSCCLSATHREEQRRVEWP